MAVCGLAGLGGCRQRSKHGGDCEGNGMGWQRDSFSGTGGRERERRELCAGREQNHMLAGEELALLVALPSTRFEQGGGAALSLRNESLRLTGRKMYTSADAHTGENTP